MQITNDQGQNCYSVQLTNDQGHNRYSVQLTNGEGHSPADHPIAARCSRTMSNIALSMKQRRQIIRTAMANLGTMAMQQRIPSDIRLTPPLALCPARRSARSSASCPTPARREHIQNITKRLKMKIFNCILIDVSVAVV